MKFLIDAQLPRRFAGWLIEAGYNALHRLELPLGNRTTDNEIVAIAEKENRIVVSKDTDFVQTFLLQESLRLFTNNRSWRRGRDCDGVALKRHRHPFGTALWASCGILTLIGCLVEPEGPHPSK